MPLTCRYYANEYPDIEDTVMVNVRQIAEMGAYVSLLEYDNKEGMILLSELSRRRIRSVNKLIRVGRNECVVVIRVDEDKGYIDLSKRRVYSKDLIQCADRFAKAKAVNSILRHVADQLNYTHPSQLEDLYEKTAWYFDKKMKKKAAAYDVFKKVISDSSVLDECDVESHTREVLIEDIRKRLMPQAVRIRADIEVSCLGYEGIDAVKDALIKGQQCSTEEIPIKINLIAAPLFAVTAQTMERSDGLAAISSALQTVKTAIESHQGTYKEVASAKVISDLDEDDVRKRLELIDMSESGSGEDEDEEESDNGKTDGDETQRSEDEGMIAPAGLDEEVDIQEIKNEKDNAPN